MEEHINIGNEQAIGKLIWNLEALCQWIIVLRYECLGVGNGCLQFKLEATCCIGSFNSAIPVIGIIGWAGCQHYGLGTAEELVSVGIWQVE